MPAIVESLIMNRGLTAHVAWRVSFIVPFILIIITAIAMLILCPDTPTGKWSQRDLAIQHNLQSQDTDTHSDEKTASIPGLITDPTSTSSSNSINSNKKRIEGETQAQARIIRGEIIQKPSFKDAINITFNPQTLLVASCYFCSFGAELAINSILGTYYLKNFPKLGETGTGRWAAMFGLLNVIFRPLGGILSDIFYRKSQSVWAKKIWLHFLALVTGAFLIAIGLTDPHDHATMFGLVAGMGLFLEAGNGANFSLVPHIHPHANGVISGVVGACGNLGGIIFAIIFRYEGKEFARTFWILGVVTIAVNVAVSWVKPIPKGQVGGR